MVAGIADRVEERHCQRLPPAGTFLSSHFCFVLDMRVGMRLDTRAGVCADVSVDMWMQAAVSCTLTGMRIGTAY